ncbi:MAG: SDR family oxidoreductase [Myxococcales bacterium]|nr:SDR family oxidoreductase [Myxococcales bacterium]MCB9756379.1 SDR family oxidoreductase [Myxococcales bacterium]
MQASSEGERRARRVALITGGARGIGRAIGAELASAGWRVAICYRASEDDARAAVLDFVARGGEGLAERCDVSDPNAARGLCRFVEDEWGRIDAVINAAGPYHRAKLLEESVDGWRSMFANNLDPVFFTAKFASPGMIARGWGRILSFSMASADHVAANTAVTAHFIAKSGVLSLSRALAKELAPHGITVNCISPGFIDSKSAPEAELKKMKKRIPAGYVGAVEDAVAAARFLLSDEARYVTGANLHVSGGWGL